MLWALLPGAVGNIWEAGPNLSERSLSLVCLTGISGLLIAAILAAAMSNLSAALNSLSSSATA